MKKNIIMLLLTLLPAIAWAQTAKAIYCSDNKTLYFVYNNATYTKGGKYDGHTITAVYTGLDDTMTQMPWKTYREMINTVVFHSTFSSFRPKSLNKWFYECRNLTRISGIGYLNTSSVTDMHALFYYCEQLPTLDVSGFKTGNVTDMSYMFHGCYVLPYIDVTKFNTSKVTDMKYMFSSCRSMPAIDLTNFNTSNVTDMCHMFTNCWILPSVDVTHFDTRKVKDMSYMFRNCYVMTSLDVSGFNTGNVTDMSYMFCDCNSLPSLDVSGFNTAKVTNMSYMFSGCYSLPSLNVSGFNTANVTDMSNMFSECYSLPSVSVSGFNTGKVTSMSNMFNGCYSLQSLDVSGFNTANVTDMSNMFSECYSLPSVSVSGFNTGKVTNMSNMFNSCSILRSLTFGKNFNMNKVTTATNSQDMFYNCSTLRYLDFHASDDTDAIKSVERTTASTMFNAVPQTTVIFLPHGSQYVTTGRNVVYSYGGDQTDLRCPWYYSEDKVDIEFPRDFKTNLAEYSRASMSSTYGTVVLPYDFTTNDDIQAYTLDEEHTETMFFKDAQTIPAHTPFAFKKLGNPEFIMEDESGGFGITVKATRSTNAEEDTWTGGNGTPYSASTNLGGWTTKGYYVNETVTDYSDTYYVAGDKFYQADGVLTMYPHRVTFHGTWTEGSPSEDAAGAKFYGIAVSDGQVTSAIEAADLRQAERDALDIYDAHGRRRDNLGRGLNIVRMSDGSVRKVVKK